MTARAYESLPSAAARIGVSVKTLRRRIAAGALPVYRTGRILRLDPEDVDALFCCYPQWWHPQSVPPEARGPVLSPAAKP